MKHLMVLCKVHSPEYEEEAACTLLKVSHSNEVTGVDVQEEVSELLNLSGVECGVEVAWTSN